MPKYRISQPGLVRSPGPPSQWLRDHPLPPTEELEQAQPSTATPYRRQIGSTPYQRSSRRYGSQGLTADNIREMIARNPQSQEMRTFLIQRAVEHDIADEIPDDWTVTLYNPENVEYDDTQDLIADHYDIPFWQASTGYTQESVTLSINAHESGAISFTIQPSTEPITKFDLPTADRLLEMFQHIDYSQSNVREQILEPLTEPTTGIRYDPTGDMTGTLTIPTNHGDEVTLLFNDPSEMITGLGAMANAAETYGQSGQEITA